MEICEGKIFLHLFLISFLLIAFLISFISMSHFVFDVCKSNSIFHQSMIRGLIGENDGEIESVTRKVYDSYGKILR